MSVIIDDKHVAFDASSYFLTPKCWRSFRRFAAWNPINSPGNFKKISLAMLRKVAIFHLGESKNANAPSSLVSLHVVQGGFAGRISKQSSPEIVSTSVSFVFKRNSSFFHSLELITQFFRPLISFLSLREHLRV